MIVKNLKNYCFEYDERQKVLTIFEKRQKGQRREHYIELPKAKMFSLMRFCIRVAQKTHSRKGK